MKTLLNRVCIAGLALVALFLMLSFDGCTSPTEPTQEITREFALDRACTYHAENGGATGQICFQYYNPGAVSSLGTRGHDAWGVLTECVDASECAGSPSLADRDAPVPGREVPCHLETRCVIKQGAVGPYLSCSRVWVCPGDDVDD